MNYSIDSRTIKPGDIFIPVKGANFDGHEFIKDVLAKGVSKVLDVDLAQYAAYYRQNKIKARVIGVTGSAGKTTVKDMITEVLRKRYKVHKTRENENNEIGVPLTLLNAPPDCDFIVVEMAMRKRGEILALAEIAQPDYVLISSIGSTHIEFLGTKRNIALAKAEIFRFKKQKAKTYYTVLNQHMNYFSPVKQIAENNRFLVKTVKEKDFLKSNEQIVTELALKLGVSGSEIKNALSHFKPESPHRQSVIKWKNNFLIDDTYNANPESMRFAIQKMIKDFPKHKKVAVIGEMKELGGYVLEEHRKLIDYILANKSIDFVCFLGNTYKQIEKKHEKCYYFQEKAQVVRHLLDKNLTGFALLFKGSRSIKMEEIIEQLLKKS